jgi:hypothetical protein
MEDHEISFYRNSKGGLQVQGETYFDFVNQLAPKIEKILDELESIHVMKKDASHSISAKITLVINNVDG